MTEIPKPLLLPTFNLQIPANAHQRTPISKLSKNPEIAEPTPKTHEKIDILTPKTAKQLSINATQNLSTTLTRSNPTQLKSTHEFNQNDEFPPVQSLHLSTSNITPVTTTNLPTPTTTGERIKAIQTLPNVWQSGKLTTQRLEQFATSILPSSVQVQLAQPFGKDSINQSFYAEKCFRHILLPLLKSGYLARRTTKKLEIASYRARQLQQLRKKYTPIDFRPLQGFQTNWEAVDEIHPDWKAMTSACLLHYNGDVATVVRWIGGPHTNEHIDTQSTLTKLKPILTQDVYSDLKRILVMGAPALCNADATETNFQAYLKYGNHQSVKQNQSTFETTIIKQSKRGLTLIMDPNLIHFTLNAHLSPQGLVDAIHKRRKPRPLSDSSFRPWPGARGINDWTSKVKEPKLYFADSFQKFCTWHWNLAISYPLHDRHTGDDDVQCAFPRIKYNPNLVAMHSAISNDTLIMNTGLTFGDNTSPSNWEPVARARQQLAQTLWSNPNIITKAIQYLPKFTFAEPATPIERKNFTTAIADSMNQGVFDVITGKRKPPQFNHHVDDNMYGDISELMPRAAAASIISLYEIVGYPDGRIPDPISWEKFGTAYGHLRRVVGWTFNTRDLTYTLPSDKRATITELVATWISKTSFTILEAAELHGTLADASRANRQGRTLFFSFQNAFRRAIQTRFNQVRGFYSRKNKIKQFQAQLPKHLHSRIDSMIARDMAALLWSTKSKIAVTATVRDELTYLHSLLANPNYKWEMQIGHVIPRDPQFTSTGDACLTGGGAYCHELEFWFDVAWSTRTTNAIDEGAIHINMVEFVVVILQLAATIAVVEEQERQQPATASESQTKIPKLAKLLIQTDNSPSQNWAHKVSSKSDNGQQLVRTYAALLNRTSLAVHSSHIKGSTNDLADFLSRQNFNSHPPAIRHQQIYEKEPKLASYRYFQPHPELLSHLESRLFNEPWTTTTTLPKQLGQFAAVGSTISSSVIL